MFFIREEIRCILKRSLDVLQERQNLFGLKGATLSDKSARKEFGLTQEEIIEAINDGKLQYRTNIISSIVAIEEKWTKFISALAVKNQYTT